MPAGTDGAEQIGVGQRDVVEQHLVEVVFAVHLDDGLDGDARGVGGHDELAESRVPMFRVQRAGAGEHHDLMRQVGAAGPHLAAIEQPTGVGARGLGGHGGQVGAGLVLAHADGGIQSAGGDSGQEAAALVLAAVGEEGGRHLPVGDPVGGHRGAVGQEFFGDDVAVHVAASAAAVLDGDGQPDEAGRRQSHAEVGVPLRQPAVDAGLPAELRRVLGQEATQVVA